MNSIPIDLFLEILSRLPADSIARCRCVSKLWVSRLRPDFTLFLTRSPARPRLLFVIQGYDGEWSIYSSPQPHSPHEKSSLGVAADYHMKFSEDMRLKFCGHASGFVCFRRMRVSKEEENLMHVICNPSTGQCASLPKLRRGINSYSLLGFDPIDEQFKVLFIADPSSDDDNRFMTLGTGEMSWRKIQCPLNHYPYSKSICINGILYYLAEIDGTSSVIVCFDVRSEKFRFIDLDFIYDLPKKLINYNGKLGVTDWKYVNVKAGTGSCTFELFIWVLEDVEKQEWSKYVYILPCKDNIFSVAGVTSTGEIVVLSEYWCTHKPFDVFYFNIERNTLQSVKIQGNYEVFDIHNQSVNVFVDHVENLKLIL